MLLTILIIFFTSIILYKVISSVGSFFKIVEGLENETTTNYQEYDKNDPNNCLILAQQNSGNIDYLKSRMDELNNVKNDISDVKQSVQTMQVQMDELVQQQGDMAVEMAGGEEPVELDGMDEDIGDEELDADEEDENI